jgi:hypothetical protein
MKIKYAPDSKSLQPHRLEYPGMPEQNHDHLVEWVDTYVIRPFRKPSGPGITQVASKFLQLAARAQLEEGIVDSQKTLLRALEQMQPEALVERYRKGFGERPLTFNRAVRLVATLHHDWIAIRGRVKPVLDGPSARS